MFQTNEVHKFCVKYSTNFLFIQLQLVKISGINFVNFKDIFSSTWYVFGGLKTFLITDYAGLLLDLHRPYWNQIKHMAGITT